MKLKPNSTMDLVKHLIGPSRGTHHRIMQAQLLNRRRISSSSTYISSDLQEELLTGSCKRSYWTDGGSHLHPYTSRWTYKRNSSQDHASAVTEQTEDFVFIHIHLVGPARGTSHRIMPAQLLNRGSRLHPHTSRRTYKRNFSQDHASAVTEQTEDLFFIHIYLVRPARGTSHRIMPAQLLNRLIKYLIFIHIPGMDSFLARLHFSAEELLLYPRRPRRRQRRRPHAKC